jgi:selenide,water dikinase
VRYAPQIDEASQMLLFDPQTSGGLLLAVPPEKLAPLLDAAARAGQVFWEVGEVVAEEGIEVVP